MRYLLLLLTFLSSPLFAAENDDIQGFWKSMDEKTGKPTSIVGVYEYKGKYYGRLIATYNDQTGVLDETMYHPESRAPALKGNPYYDGLDFIWDLTKRGNKYVDGLIVDPKKGRVYGAEMWREGPDLIVRGQILFLGRNQKWPPATAADLPPDFIFPDMKTFVPKIPEVVKK